MGFCKKVKEFCPRIPGPKGERGEPGFPGNPGNFSLVCSSYILYVTIRF